LEVEGAQQFGGVLPAFKGVCLLLFGSDGSSSRVWWCGDVRGGKMACGPQGRRGGGAWWSADLLKGDVWCLSTDD